MNIGNYRNYNLLTQQAKPKQDNVNFGWQVFVDGGASRHYNGSIKVDIKSDSGVSLFNSEKECSDARMKLASVEGFQSGSDYPKAIISRVKQFVKMAQDKGVFNSLEGEDKKLSGLVFTPPCPVIDNFAKIISNLFIKGTQQSLTNVDFKPMAEDLKANYQTSDNFKLVVTNDMAGGCAGIAKELLSRNKLDVGTYASVLLTGGGFGVANIKVEQNCGKDKTPFVKIETTEAGHTESVNKKSSLEAVGASGPALVRNYLKALNKMEAMDKFSDKEIQTIVDIGCAKMVTKQPFKLKVDSEEYQKLMDTGRFKVVKEGTEAGEDGKAVQIAKLKICGVNEEEHLKASKKSIDKYIDALGQLAAQRVLDMANMIVVTGPVAGKIKEEIAENPETFNNKTFKELLSDKINTHLIDSVGASVKQDYKFDIVDDIAISDNTVGGALLLKGDFIAPQRRGNWINIPLEEFKN